MSAPTTTLPGGTWDLGGVTVPRFGYGAMQLAGHGVMGPPADPAGAVRVLRAAVEAGIRHVDTSGAYGPRVTNELVGEALRHSGTSLVVATKVGATRDAQGGWPVARRPHELREQVEDDLRTLGVETLELVNLRMGDATGPLPGSLAEAFGTLLELRTAGLVRRVGLSNVTRDQVAEARALGPVTCVQNLYNLAHREDDALVDELAGAGIAFVPFFPLGGFSPLQSEALTAVAARHAASSVAVALAWLLQRSSNVLLIPGTSSTAHLLANVRGAGTELTSQDLVDLDAIADVSLVA